MNSNILQSEGLLFLIDVKQHICSTENSVKTSRFVDFCNKPIERATKFE